METLNTQVASFGGGTGGVIQIISPLGNLSAHSLSLRPGKDSDGGKCGGQRQPIEANGYYYLQGMVYNGRLNLDNLVISSKPFSGVLEPGYSYTLIAGDIVIRYLSHQYST